MCLPQLSTGVNRVWEKINKKGAPPYDYDYQSENMIKQHARTLEYIDIIGGEPFYHKKFLSLLDWLVDNKCTENLTIFVTSNMTKINFKIIEQLKKFKKVVISASLDGVDKTYEYIRPGAKFDTVWKNMETCRKHFDVLVATTVNVLNIIRLPDVDDWCIANGYHQQQKGLVYNPSEMNPKQLPTKLRPLVTEKYQAYLQPKTQPCIPFIRELDKLWNTDICYALPEWQEVITGAGDYIEKDYEIYRRTLDWLKKI
tara:strand:+ start:29 stop:796 length:768 start_codon:yes stop_codon:yes gene_type:complete